MINLELIILIVHEIMDKRDLIKFYTYLDNNDYLKEEYKNGQSLINTIGNYIKTIPNRDTGACESKIMVLDFYTFDTIEDYNKFAMAEFDEGRILTPISVTKWSQGYTIYFYVK